MKHKINVVYSLYLIAGSSLVGARNFLGCIREALSGGVTVVQLREKDISSRDFYHLGLQVKELTQEYQVPLIINDRLDVALAIEADGVHLGQTDLPAPAARRIMGSGKLLGLSVNNLDEALRAQDQGADYVGAGAVFPTTTKTDTQPISLANLALIKNKLQIPVLAIGGINDTNIPLLKKTCIDGFCTASAILGQDDIRQAAQDLKNIWK